MRFTKSHGTGNDFLLVENLSGEIDLASTEVAALCDRHFGVGGDGLILIARGESAPFFMDYRNADGSVAEMCGNGLRCMAKYLFDRDLSDSSGFEIETRAGIKQVKVEVEGELAGLIEVEMGRPNFTREAIPITGDGETALEEVIDLGSDFAPVTVSCVSMGNPHAVVFVDSTESAPVTILGPALESSERFPEGANIEFVEIHSSSHLEMRVWERGVGETLSCGTGACAALAVTARLGRCDPTVDIDVPGGRLHLTWDGSIKMSGPAVEVFEAEIDLDRLVDERVVQ